MDVRTLAEEFPDKPPVLKLKNFRGKAHPFMNADGVFIGFSQLSPSLWSVHHNLGLLIRDICKQLERNPPKVAEPAIDPWGPQPSQFGANAVAKATPLVNVDPWDGSKIARADKPIVSAEPVRTLSPIEIPMPVLPGNFSEVDRLSLSEIQELLEDDMLLNNFVESLGNYKGPQSLRDDLQEDVINLARQNLEKKEELEMTKREVLLYSEMLEEEVRRAEEFEKKRREQLSVYSLKNLSDMLADGMDKDDIESEEVRSQFENGKLDLNEFVKQYLKIRTEYHKKFIVKERLCP